MNAEARSAAASLSEGMVATAPVPAVIADRGGTVLAANLRAAALFGESPTALIQAGLARRAPERALADALAAGVGAVLQTEGRRADGSDFPLQATLMPMSDGDRVLILFEDLTARLGAEASLRYKEALLASQNEAAVDGILVTDADSRIVSMNRRFLEMWDIPGDLMRVGASDEAALRHALDKLEDPSEFIEKIEWLFDHPRAETRDEVAFKDGRIFDRWSSPVLGADGTYYGRGWYFRDMTDRKRREAELSSAYDRLKEAERFRAELVRNVSHDLASPLTPLRVQLHLLLSSLETPTSTKQRHALEVMARNLEHIRRLVDDLRDVGLLEAGEVRLTEEDVDLASLVEHAAASFRDAAAAAGIEFTVRVEDRLPARVDPHRIAQVLFNLVTNALKFTPAGGRVTLVASRAGDDARFDVEDTGRGLAGEEIARLFRPFSQVHAPEEARERGTGLGLYVCRGLVERHGGRIWVESEGLGKGSRFSVTLPMRPA